tara:strand:- start:767 stop:2740 length:1974 start_codon:yes stop_codon:yes gene_type:complete
MAKRKYTKRSNYWDKFNKKTETYVPIGKNGEVQPDLLGDPFYTSDASFKEVSKARRQSASTSGFTGSRKNRSAFVNLKNRFSSIDVGLLPYDYAADGIDVRDTIELCQKAYANVAVFRNAIDIMSEFTNTDIYLEGGTKKSREFFYEWFKRINILSIKDQYFREYYRSGNVFLYRVDGRFKADDYAKLMNQVGSINPSQNKIPIRYILLNPYDIVAKRATTFSVGAYEKVLSEYELARLQNPQTEEDVELFNSLDPDTQKAIQDGGYTSKGLKVQLDAQRLSFSFYKKQDYEPFAIPFGFPVLEDINAKMELKKMDQAITRTVENVILLITMGADPDKGGINANNLAAMQNLFKNESVGRVLVSDYTTKAEFVIPELNRVLGPDKYKILNEDIKQGLQNIVVGEEKFSSTQVKAQIFIDRLKEARGGFLNDFLQREIKRISKELGLRSYPEVKMKDIDMRDEAQLMRVSTRLMELGILTPQQGMEMFHNGRFPEADKIAPAQKDFVDERKEGYYNPLVGGVPMVEADIGGGPKTPKQGGRPEGTTGVPIVNAQYSRNNIQKTIYEIDEFINSAKATMMKNVKSEKLSEAQEQMVDDLCESIVCSESKESWAETMESCVKDFEEIENLQTLTEVLSISSEHNLELYPAAILHHSKENS